MIAAVSTLRDFSEYLDLKRKYDPPTPVDGAVAKPDMNTSVSRLLRALQITPEDEKTHQRALASQYNRFLELRRRFEERGEGS